MYKILFVTAYSGELKIVKKQIKNLKIPNLQVSYFSFGAGNYNAILNLTRFLEKNNFDFIVNVGICGYKDFKKDFFQVSRIFNFSNKKELITPYILDFGDLESVFCSEEIVYDKDILGDEKFVDMESYGFEKVLESFKIPRIILKVPIDKIGIETKNFDFKKAEEYLNKNINYKKLLEKIVDYLGKNKKERLDFSKYFEKFNFSFSQEEIFKKLFYKYKALVSDDFEKYFIENKNSNKKEFLKNLDDFLEKYLIK